MAPFGGLFANPRDGVLHLLARNELEREHSRGVHVRARRSFLHVDRSIHTVDCDDFAESVLVLSVQLCFPVDLHLLRWIAISIDHRSRRLPLLADHRSEAFDELQSAIESRSSYRSSSTASHRSKNVNHNALSSRRW